jgi:hypothetical protein
MLLLAALVCVLVCATAAHAEQQLFAAYDELLTRVHPAPLLATNLPPSLGPIDEPGDSAGWIEFDAVPESRGYYSLTYTHMIPSPHPGTRAKLASDMEISELHVSSLAVARRKERHFYRFSPATVRGHPGLQFRPKHGTTTGYLWAEDGRVFEIATATPHTLSNAELMNTAQTLGHLGADVFAQTLVSVGFGTSIGAGADILVTDVAVIANVNWEPLCTERAEGIQFPGQGGAIFTLALSNGSFSLPPTPVAVPETGSGGGPSTWTVSISGSIAGAGGTLTVGASGEDARETCSLAPTTASLAPNPNA